VCAAVAARPPYALHREMDRPASSHGLPAAPVRPRASSTMGSVDEAADGPGSGAVVRKRRRSDGGPDEGHVAGSVVKRGRLGEDLAVGLPDDATTSDEQRRSAADPPSPAIAYVGATAAGTSRRGSVSGAPLTASPASLWSTTSPAALQRAATFSTGLAHGTADTSGGGRGLTPAPAVALFSNGSWGPGGYGSYLPAGREAGMQRASSTPYMPARSPLEAEAAAAAATATSRALALQPATLARRLHALSLALECVTGTSLTTALDSSPPSGGPPSTKTGTSASASAPPSTTTGSTALSALLHWRQFTLVTLQRTGDIIPVGADGLADMSLVATRTPAIASAVEWLRRLQGSVDGWASTPLGSPVTSALVRPGTAAPVKSLQWWGVCDDPARLLASLRDAGAAGRGTGGAASIAAASAAAGTSTNHSSSSSGYHATSLAPRPSPTMRVAGSDGTTPAYTQRHSGQMEYGSQQATHMPAPQSNVSVSAPAAHGGVGGPVMSQPAGSGKRWDRHPGMPTGAWASGRPAVPYPDAAPATGGGGGGGSGFTFAARAAYDGPSVSMAMPALHTPAGAFVQPPLSAAPPHIDNGPARPALIASFPVGGVWPGPVAATGLGAGAAYNHGHVPHAAFTPGGPPGATSVALLTGPPAPAMAPPSGSLLPTHAPMWHGVPLPESSSGGPGFRRPRGGGTLACVCESDCM